ELFWWHEGDLHNIWEVVLMSWLIGVCVPLCCRRLFVRKCSSCLQVIGRSELIMRVLGQVYHLGCFSCCECERRLQRGDEFVLKEGQLLCRGDYEKEREMLAAISPTPTESVKSEDEDGGGGSVEKGGDDGKEHKRSKRPRTILTTQQRRAFKASFEVSSKPCRKGDFGRRDGTDCAGRAGLVPEPEGQDGSSGHGLDSLMAYSSLPRQQLLALDPNIYGGEPFRHGLTPPQLGPEQLHSYDSETVFHDLDSEASLSHLGDCLLATAEGGLLSGRVGNPIDRLYSMQNSYFTS
ncbi:LIM homeobox transcription factor 1-alpha-like, partial [Scleropages formosus]